MRKTHDLGMLAALVAVPLMMSSLSIAQAPPPPPAPVMPPSLPPTHVIDLMTPEGSAAFGAKWKTMEAKIIEERRLCSRRERQTSERGEIASEKRSYRKLEASVLFGRQHV